MSQASISGALGTSCPRVDGPFKVSGRARYTADFAFPGMLHAVPVCATVARGSLAELDTAAAAAMPGVRKVFTRADIGRFYRVNEDTGAHTDETRPPLDDDTVRYYGQYLALVVADSFEQASAAAAAVRARYEAEPPQVDEELEAEGAPEVDSERGQAARAFAAAPVKLDETYATPPETHVPIELHASVALWDGHRFTLYETSQAIMNHREVMAQMLGVEPGRVRVVTEYLGSGFGGKLWPWPHSLLAAAAARELGRPVKLAISRRMSFHGAGHRAATRQRIRLGAEPDGRLRSLQHDYVYHCARAEHTKENCGEATPFLYGTPNLRVTAAFARRDVAPNTSMRGPGAVPGLFALESAMDELAVRLGIDPVELRLRNEPAIDESVGLPFSSRHLRECLERGAERFGWARRDPGVGAMRDGRGRVLGWGMAAASWMARRAPAQAAVRLDADGGVRVSSGTQDIGTGTYTVLAQMVAELTGVPLARIGVAIGDTDLPPGPLSGGSMATASLVPAVAQAAREAIGRLQELAVRHASAVLGGDPAALGFGLGRVHRKSEPAERGVPFEAILREARAAMVEGRGQAPASDKDEAARRVSIHSFGAHFVEVAWQPAIARLEVNRVVTVIDGGRIVNPRTGRNQVEGAIVMGLGMALLERTDYDPRDGAPVNSNLADYLVASHADTPPTLDVSFLDVPDPELNEFGVRGIGEIGLAGVAPAIAAAVHHATGVRVRALPIRIEDLLAAPLVA